MLQDLPSDMEGVYNCILLSIPDAYAAYAHRAFQWMAYSGRQLFLDEVAEAAVLSWDCSIDLDNRFPNPYDIVDICSNLVTITSDTKHEAKRNWISFSHYSLKEYLLSNTIKASPAAAFSITEANAQNLISQSTLNYQLSAIRLSAIPVRQPVSFPLLGYATAFWYNHYAAVASKEAVTESLLASVVELFDMKRNESMLNGEDLSIPVALEGPDLIHRSSPGFPPPLYYASLLGMDDVVPILVDRGDDVDKTGGFCGTALQAAAYGDHVNVAIRLLDSGANVDTQSGYFGDALQAAASRGNMRLMQTLLDSGANVGNACGHYGNALQAAATGGHAQEVKLLIEFGADVNAKGGEHGTALIAAARGGHYDVARMLWENGADINGRETKQNSTALYAAAASGHDEVVGLLLDKGADPNVGGGEYGTALRAAARGGFADVVGRLVRSGAKLNATDSSGQDAGASALHLAAEGGHDTVVEMLLKRRSVNPNAVTREGLSPLMEAASGGHAAVVQLLLEKGAMMETVDKTGATALLRATHAGHEEVVNLLVHRGADVQVRDQSGSTPLSVAVAAGRDTLVHMLLCHGADPNTITSLGSTPLLEAVEKEHEGVVSVLLQAGAEVDEPSDLSGKSALDMAKSKGNESIVRLLEAHTAALDKGHPPQAKGATEKDDTQLPAMHTSSSDQFMRETLDRLDPETRSALSKTLQDQGLDLPRLLAQVVASQLKDKQTRASSRSRPQVQVIQLEKPRMPPPPRRRDAFDSSDEFEDQVVVRRPRVAASDSGVLRRRDSFGNRREGRPVFRREHRYIDLDRDRAERRWEERMYLLHESEEARKRLEEETRRRYLEEERRRERIDMDLRMLDDRDRRLRHRDPLLSGPEDPVRKLREERRHRERSSFWM